MIAFTAAQARYLRQPKRLHEERDESPVERLLAAQELSKPGEDLPNFLPTAAMPLVHIIPLPSSSSTTTAPTTIILPLNVSMRLGGEFFVEGGDEGSVPRDEHVGGGYPEVVDGLGVVGGGVGEVNRAMTFSDSEARNNCHMLVSV